MIKTPDVIYRIADRPQSGSSMGHPTLRGGPRLASAGGSATVSRVPSCRFHFPSFVVSHHHGWNAVTDLLKFFRSEFPALALLNLGHYLIDRHNLKNNKVVGIGSGQQFSIRPLVLFTQWIGI